MPEVERVCDRVAIIRGGKALSRLGHRGPVDVREVVRPLSPIRWYLEPKLLASGSRVPNILVFAGITVASYLVARSGFEKRDLAV